MVTYICVAAINRWVRLCGRPLVCVGPLDRGLHVQHPGTDTLVATTDLLLLQAHTGAVLSLAYSPSYVVSLGEDGRLCVWERLQGHLINSINTVSPRMRCDCSWGRRT